MNKGEILIYGEIGQDGVSAKFIQSELARNKDEKEITVYINSVGGDVFEGYAIYNALKQSGKVKKAVVQGMCASIATVIAGAAKEIVMSKASEYYIHNPFTAIEGDADKLRMTADELDKIKSTIVGVYKDLTGKKEEELWDLMNAETSYTGEEAVKAGFAHSVMDGLKAVARYDSKLKEDVLPADREGLVSFLKKELGSLKNYIKGVKNLMDTTGDGVEIEVEGDTVQDGAMVWVVEEGERIGAAPEGEHVLTNAGVSIVVDGEGKITEVKEGEVSNEEDEEEDIENKRIEELQNKIDRLEKAMANKSTKEKESALDKKLAKIENQISALADMTPIDDDEPGDAPANYKGKRDKGNASFDAAAKSLKKQIYG